MRSSCRLAVVAGETTIVRLVPSPLAQLARAASLVSLFVSAGTLLFFGGGLAYLFLGAAPALYYFAMGVPRAYEVDSDRVVVRRTVRRDWEWAGRDFALQRLPDELVLVGPNTSHGIERARVGDDFDRLGDALQAIARETRVVPLQVARPLQTPKPF